MSELPVRCAGIYFGRRKAGEKSDRVYGSEMNKGD